jgi:thiamine kinase-like enzyme
MIHLQQALAFARTEPRFADLAPAQIQPIQGVTNLNNHVYRFTHAGDEFFLRLASESGSNFGIRRSEELAAMQAATAAGIAPPLICARASGDFILAYIRGRHWTKDDFADPRQADRLGRLIQAMHRVQLERGLGVPMMSRLERMHANALRLRAPLPDGIEGILERCRGILAEPGDPTVALNHNDLWANNFLDDGSRLWVVDWEFAGTGNGLHDLNTALLSTGYAGGLKDDFIRACGHDPAGLEERLTRYQHIVHAFEGLWAIVQHGLRGSAEHDYLGMARSHFTGMQA